MNYIKDINLKEKDIYNVIIEIPKGTANKYELIEPANEQVECVRKVKAKYPFYYGCFPQTFAGDKDPLDMILLSNKKRKILDVVPVQVIGVIKTIDNEEIDDKVLVIACDEEIKDLHKLEARALKFLESYKGKKANMVIDKTIYDCEEALKIIKKAHNAYIKKNTNTTKSNLKIMF